MSRTEELLEQIDKKHEWHDGQTRSRGGTTLSRADTCGICGLTRHYFSDSQNAIGGRYSFTDAADRPLTLRQAAELPC